MSPFLDQRSKWNWKNVLKTFFHNIYFPHWASSGSYFTLRGLMCAMTLIQDLRSKVKVTRDLFRSSSGPFILSYLLNLAKTTCRLWVYSTYTLTQVSMIDVISDFCVKDLSTRYVFPLCFICLILHITMPSWCMIRSGKKNQVRGQGQAKTSYSKFWGSWKW